MIRLLFYISIGFAAWHYGYRMNPIMFIIAVLVLDILFVFCLNYFHGKRRISQQQSLEGLTALLRIRSAELGAMFHSIRGYQKNLKNGSWIPLFIAEYRSNSSYNFYDDEDQDKKKEKKYLNKALALYGKRFENNRLFGTLNEPELNDIGVAILCWSSSLDTTIRLLNSIPCNANLSHHVGALLREYRLIQFLTLNGNYHILFKNWRPLSDLIRLRYQLLRAHWEELLRSHQCSIIISQASNYFQNSSLVADDIWAENVALGQMERNLKRALSQENSKSFGWEWDWKQEEGFFQALKTNPIWIKLYGYEPYTTSELYDE